MQKQSQPGGLGYVVGDDAVRRFAPGLCFQEGQGAFTPTIFAGLERLEERLTLARGEFAVDEAVEEDVVVVEFGVHINQFLTANDR